MEKSRPSPIPTSATSRTKNPAWWTDKHTSAWERVKDAFERDWLQTKADFSSEGRDLKQNVADTVKQAVGSEPIPPPNVPTHPLDAKDAEKARDKVAKADEKAAKTIGQARAEIDEVHQKLAEDIGGTERSVAGEQAEAREKIASARESAAQKIAKEQADAREKIASAQDSAAKKIAKEHEKIADAEAERQEAVRKWREAESEARFGHGARMQYPTMSEWDDTTEATLRNDWNTLGGRSWEEAKPGIRRGWNFGPKAN